MKEFFAFLLKLAREHSLLVLIIVLALLTILGKLAGVDLHLFG